MKKKWILCIAVLVVIVIAVAVILTVTNKTCMVTVTLRAEGATELVGGNVELRSTTDSSYFGGSLVDTSPGSLGQFGVKKGTYVLTVTGLTDGWTAGDPVTLDVTGDMSCEVALTRQGSSFAFQYWEESSAAFTALVDFVESVTDENSPDFIPQEDRIAVSDMDGTLLCETSPYYFEWMMFFYRVLDDPDYDAPTEIRSFVENVARPAVSAGTVTDEIDARFSLYQAEVYSGMTRPQYHAFVERFMEQPVENHDNMTYGKSFYLPMREVVDYLKANGFTFYIVSGADRETCRVLGTEELGLDANHIIGSDSLYRASGQGETDGEFYTMTPEDQVVRGELVIKNLKMNKVSAIVREIGKQPVLAFGNSSGDYSMLTYVTTGNPYRSAGFMLLCDDLERDCGNLEKAETIRAASEEKGWYTISMRDDFLTIYAEDVLCRMEYDAAA